MNVRRGTTKVRVATRASVYDVVIGHGMLEQLPRAMRRVHAGPVVGLVTDATVARRWLVRVQNVLARAGWRVIPVVVPPGEQQKSMRMVEEIAGRFLRAGMGRDGAVVAFGGGVVGDLAGFVAATYQRGVPVVQMPTTLLAQVDSSIGGKVGVNHALGKNMIGAFHPPALVWSDAAWLGTLPRRELTSGLAEVIKYGIIRDRRLFRWLESELDRVYALEAPALRFIVERSSAIKARVVSADEREQGLRMILNHGHTVGHAIETATGYAELRHGEAVLLGMRVETHMALWLGLLPERDAHRILALLDRIPVVAPRVSVERVLRHMGRDKKNRRGSVRFVLATSIGSVRIVDAVDPAVIVDSLRASLPTRR